MNIFASMNYVRVLYRVTLDLTSKRRTKQGVVGRVVGNYDRH